MPNVTPLDTDLPRRQLIERIVKRLIRRTVGIRANSWVDAWSVERTLASFGCDQIDRASIAMAVEDTFGIELADEQVTAIQTPAQLIVQIENALDAERAATDAVA